MELSLQLFLLPKYILPPSHWIINSVPPRDHPTFISNIVHVKRVYICLPAFADVLFMMILREIQKFMLIYYGS